MANPDPNVAMQMVAELEIEMMSDMYRRYSLLRHPFSLSFYILIYLRMTNACHRKCIPSNYRESDLAKGESVCLDRCVAKYLDIHERLGKRLTTMSVQDEQMLQKLQQQQPGKS